MATQKILDQFGTPIDRAVLQEPQTSRIAYLQDQYLTPMLNGLTPARLARILKEADNGDLLSQHRMFSDMEERDAHLAAEMGKRKNALASLDWDIAEPRNANAAEKAATEWVREVLTDAVDPIEDLVLALMDAIGHGFAPVELEWRQEGGELLPAFYPRPQEWFRLNLHRTELRLRDVSVEGMPLAAFGWVMHTHGKPKTGYLGRVGLHRTLCWPFLYKAYGIGDFAEFLETFGLPIIVGKYFSGASADEKASLMRAVNSLGHDARAIMPQEMSLEIQKVTGSGEGSPHMAMVEWAEKSESKCILGQTLSADTGKSGGGSYALGKVHNEVRHDILRADARQVAGTITRDLVYALIAINKGGITSLARCPQFRFDLGDSEDLTAYAEALPKLVGVGFKVPRPWAQEKLRIPEPQEGEDVLAVATPAPPPAGSPPAGPQAGLTAALSANPPEEPGQAPLDAAISAIPPDVMQAMMEEMLAPVMGALQEAGGFEAAMALLAARFPEMPTAKLDQLLGQAMFAAQAWGYDDAGQ